MKKIEELIDDDFNGVVSVSKNGESLYQLIVQRLTSMMKSAKSITQIFTAPTQKVMVQEEFILL